jgi:hypothetical protein
VTAQEMAEKLDARLRDVEGFKSYAYGFAAVLVFVTGGFAYTFVNMHRDVGVHANRLAAVEQNYAALAEKHQKLYDTVNLLRGRITVLYDRSGKGLAVEAIVYWGTVRSITAKDIVILPDELDEPAMRFLLPDSGDVAVRSRTNQPLALKDVKVGARVGILPGAGGRVAMIHVE